MTNVAIIDIGSNSVRIRISSGGKVLFRQTVTTQLSKNIKNKMLCSESVERTFCGIDELIRQAEEYNATVYAFATAAVRNNENGKDFAKEFFNRYNVALDVVSGETEGTLGINGALSGADGTVIDVGGASSEIAVKINGKIAYDHSLADGAVTLTDLFGKNEEQARAYLKGRISEYGMLPKTEDIYLIGGTATSLSHMLSGDLEYDREKNHGRIITLEALDEFTDLLYSKTSEEIKRKYNVNAKRAEIIHSGSAIISEILRFINKDKAIVSENDNLEGYYQYIIGENK